MLANMACLAAAIMLCPSHYLNDLGLCVQLLGMSMTFRLMVRPLNPTYWQNPTFVGAS